MVWRWGVLICAYPVVIIDDAHAKHALQIPKVFQVRREPWAFSAAFLCSLPSGCGYGLKEECMILLIPKHPPSASQVLL